MNMTLKQAMDLVSKVCGKFVGNLQDHEAIQAALNVVRTAAFQEPEKDESNTETK